MATTYAPRTAPRIETVDRWVRAFTRSLESGVDEIELPNDAGYLVPSSSDPAVAYTVSRDGRSCTCAAAEAGDPVCQHRARIRFFNHDLPGVENAPGTEPASALPVMTDADTLAFARVFVVTPEPSAPIAECSLCHGRGFTEVYGPTGRLDDYVDETCWHCGGSGFQSRRSVA